MSSFLHTKYQALEAYTPGEQPGTKQYIKLNTNESPYPPSQAVLTAWVRRTSGTCGSTPTRKGRN